MYRIMLADADRNVTDMLKGVIEKQFPDSCVIESARTGRGAIELAERFRPDIVCMDIWLSGITGMEVMKEIRHSRQDVILMILTAYDLFYYAKESVNLGVFEYMNKPAREETVISAFERAVKQINKKRLKRRQELVNREKLVTILPILEQGFIEGMLYHTGISESVYRFQEALDIKSDYGYFFVIYLEERRKSRGRKLQGVEHDRWIIREVIKEKTGGVVGNQMSEGVPVFVPCNCVKIDNERKKQVLKNSGIVARKLEEKLHIPIRIGIGSIYPIKEAFRSFQEALDALNSNTSRIFYYAEEYQRQTPEEYFREEEFKREAVNGDRQSFELQMNYLLDWMKEAFSQQENEVKLKALELILQIENIVYQEEQSSQYQVRRKNYLPAMFQIHTYEELKKWFCTRAELAFREVALERERCGETLVSRAQRYIRNKFKEDISLDEVAEKLKISPYYLSRLFKKQTGVNFIDYLTEVRIEYAKKMLEESEGTIREIGFQSGYADPNYFSRLFKKRVGMTPSVYKERKVR